MADKASSLPRLVLYKREFSPPSWAVMMLAEILGLKMDFKEPDFMNLEHKSDAFVKMNPLGTIPVLVDDDFVVSESHSIMQYLLSKYGGDHKERLYPSDVKIKSKVDTCLFFDASILFIRLKVVALPTIMNGYPGATPEQLADIDEAYGVLEAYLQNSKYVAANHLTIADLSLGSTTAAMQTLLKLDENKFARTAEWFARINNESYFKTISQPGAAIVSEVMNSFWEKNKRKD